MHLLAKTAELLLDALPNGFERCEPGGSLDGVDADAVGRAVIDGGKETTAL